MLKGLLKFLKPSIKISITAKNIGDGDTLIVQCHGPIRPEQAETIRAAVRGLYPDHLALVMDGSCELVILPKDTDFYVRRKSGFVIGDAHGE